MPKIKTVRGIENRKVVSPKAWVAARKKLLVKEKKFSRLRDELNLQRRKLPWVKIEKDYVFDGPTGRVTLADLFCGKSQLIIYHFMFGPGWGEGCPHCSFWADHYDSATVHLGQRDTAFAVISRAPLHEIEPFKRRMGWRFKWVSSFNTGFNFDFNVSFTPEQVKSGVLPYNYGRFKMEIDELQGVSAFYRDKNGDIYHTYSAYARGIDLMNTTYNFLDLTAKGRDENPEARQDWCAITTNMNAQAIAAATDSPCCKQTRVCRIGHTGAVKRRANGGVKKNLAKSSGKAEVCVNREPLVLNGKAAQSRICN